MISDILLFFQDKFKIGPGQLTLGKDNFIAADSM